ncbi:hypothetical protein CPCC7001_555 [Cyanobium sp. PCC 7001]|nr:hypothetical protein CPCC7001_555 [Cyanobium sp. PCC 7001]
MKPKWTRHLISSWPEQAGELSAEQHGEQAVEEPTDQACTTKVREAKTVVAASFGS